MSTAPPPGYNPGESMLQGGNTAQILPVQGGGGAAAPENVSLLQGGETAVLHPVQGGGADYPLDFEGRKFKQYEGELANVDNTRAVPLGTRIYYIRIGDINDDAVKNDWLESKFTDDEAQFLNDLYFTQDVLTGVFGDRWRITLKEFLYLMSASKCFSDDRFLLSSECDKARTIINVIHNYFLTNPDIVSKVTEKEEDALREEIRIVKDALMETKNDAIHVEAEASKRVEAAEAEKGEIAETLGVDLNNLEAYKSDPFTERGPLTMLDEYPGTARQQGGGTFNALGTIAPSIMLDATGAYSIIIVAVEKRSGTYKKAQLRVNARTYDEATNKSLKMLNTLQSKYPGWVFIV
jgi:hypothetical protein